MYKIKKLSFSYRKDQSEKTLKDVTFNLPNGCLNVLVGQNGSGKTTIMDCIAGINNSENENEIPAQKSIVYMTQNMFLSPHSLGNDILNLIKGMCSKEESQNFEMNFKNQLEKNEIDKFHHLMNMTVGKMSEGEKKWLYITLLSILNRELYLFDEPTSGIDPMSRKLILKRLKYLSNSKSVLISTHQLQDLNNSDSEVIFIDNGIKLYEGNFNEWLSKLKTNNPDEAFEKTIEMNSKLS